jgi:hypothetical protein
MAQIEPVVFPIKGEAVRLDVTIGAFKTDASMATTYYALKKEDGTSCIEGNYDLTPEQYDSWGEDNSVVEQYVADYLGVTIIGPNPPEEGFIQP